MLDSGFLLLGIPSVRVGPKPSAFRDSSGSKTPGRGGPGRRSGSSSGGRDESMTWKPGLGLLRLYATQIRRSSTVTVYLGWTPSTPSVVCIAPLQAEVHLAAPRHCFFPCVLDGAPSQLCSLDTSRVLTLYTLSPDARSFRILPHPEPHSPKPRAHTVHLDPWTLGPEPST